MLVEEGMVREDNDGEKGERETGGFAYRCFLGCWRGVRGGDGGGLSL